MAKNYFLISDTFYRMEYDVPHHSIFDIYIIGSWSFLSQKKYKEVSYKEISFYFNEILRDCPWLYVKKVLVRTETEPWNSSSQENLSEYFDNLKDIHNEPLVCDIATFECGINFLYNNKIIKLSHKNEVDIHCFFDEEYKKLYFNLYFYIDIFTQNPSRQPNIYMYNNEHFFNKDVLKDSFKTIENRNLLYIESYESNFHPNIICKYGFI
jgi:hypothetical protein